MFSLKKCAAFFVTVGIVCALFSSPALAKNATGYIPEPFDTTYLRNDPPRFPAKHINNDRVGATDDSLPVSYDLRNYGRVPAVRNQNPYGTCWAHATLGAMEANYLTQRLNDTISEIDSVDLSELHMSWFVYKDPGEGKSFPIGTANFGSGVLGQGGNAAMSTAYLTRLAGAVYESKMPYSEAGTDASAADTILTNLVGSKEATDSSYAPIALRLLERYDMGLVSKDNRDLVKQMVMEHGAVQISYYAGSGAYNPDSSTTAYFYNSGDITNHAVLIVGWDDNFASKDFNADASKCPKENGAWLVRNSWGSSWGDKGYFWMSYEQYINWGYVFIAGDYEFGLKHYGYDYLGLTNASVYSNTAYGANVFSADSYEIIESAAFYTCNNNTSCDVYVYDLGTEAPSSPVSGILLTSSSGHYYPIAGYHTVKFDSAVPISAGHYFSVVVKFEHTGNACVPFSNSGKIVSGVSYTSSSLTSDWKVCTADNACIKAFTLPSSNTSKFAFVGNSLVLSGQLGLDFYAVISDDVDSSDVYIDFKVNGKTGSKIPFSDGVKQSDGTYMFTCYINSVQMADDITAAIHSGDKYATVQRTVSQYLDELIALIEANYTTESADLKTLANAIKDYGHYVQPILAQTNEWTLGTDHKIMACNDTAISSDINDVKTALHTNFVIYKSNPLEGFSDLQLDLELDTDTAINLYFTKKSGVEGDVDAAVDDGKSFSASKQSDGLYLVSITGIPAHELGTPHTVTVGVVGSSGKSEVKVSALTYADLVLQSDSTETSLKEAVIALYKYYSATKTYRSKAGYKD